MDRPIIFSGPMVRAILENRKTQTRRVINPQPEWSADPVFMEELRVWAEPNTGKNPRACYLGRPGDMLWVRESWCLYDKHESRRDMQALQIPPGPDGSMPGAEGYWKRRVFYAADGNPDPVNPWKMRPSIHMPRWASRITLEMASVQPQRLQDISEPDARAEGVEHCDNCRGWRNYGALPHAAINHYADPRDSFTSLWDSLNRIKHPWRNNPWVWKITFKMVVTC